jgi:hypothetical protein
LHYVCFPIMDAAPHSMNDGDVGLMHRRDPKKDSLSDAIVASAQARRDRTESQRNSQKREREGRFRSSQSIRKHVVDNDGGVAGAGVLNSYASPTSVLEASATHMLPCGLVTLPWDSNLLTRKATIAEALAWTQMRVNQHAADWVLSLDVCAALRVNDARAASLSTDAIHGALSALQSLLAVLANTGVAGVLVVRSLAVQCGYAAAMSNACTGLLATVQYFSVAARETTLASHAVDLAPEVCRHFQCVQAAIPDLHQSALRMLETLLRILMFMSRSYLEMVGASSSAQLPTSELPEPVHDTQMGSVSGTGLAAAHGSPGEQPGGPLHAVKAPSACQCVVRPLDVDIEAHIRCSRTVYPDGDCRATAQEWFAALIRAGFMRALVQITHLETAPLVVMVGTAPAQPGAGVEVGVVIATAIACMGNMFYCNGQEGLPHITGMLDAVREAGVPSALAAALTTSDVRIQSEAIHAIQALANGTEQECDAIMCDDTTTRRFIYGALRLVDQAAWSAVGASAMYLVADLFLVVPLSIGLDTLSVMLHACVKCLLKRRNSLSSAMISALLQDMLHAYLSLCDTDAIDMVMDLMEQEDVLTCVCELTTHTNKSVREHAQRLQAEIDEYMGPEDYVDLEDDGGAHAYSGAAVTGTLPFGGGMAGAGASMVSGASSTFQRLAQSFMRPMHGAGGVPYGGGLGVANNYGNVYDDEDDDDAYEDDDFDEEDDEDGDDDSDFEDDSEEDDCDIEHAEPGLGTGFHGSGGVGAWSSATMAHMNSLVQPVVNTTPTAETAVTKDPSTS